MGAALGCVNTASSMNSSVLTIEVDSSLSIPKDLDALDLQVSTSDTIVFHETFALASGARTLPTSLQVPLRFRPGERFRVMTFGFRGQTPRVFFQAIVRPARPKEFVRIFLSPLCAGSRSVGASEGGRGDLPCGLDGTCQAGVCANGDEVGAQLLEEAASGPSAASSPQDCMAVEPCFSGLSSVPVRKEARGCMAVTREAISDTTAVALVTSASGLGVCQNQGPCWIPLRQGGRPDDWRNESGQVRLPDGLCQGEKSEVILSNRCPDAGRRPFCRPWESAAVAPSVNDSAAKSGSSPGTAMASNLEGAVEGLTAEGLVLELSSPGQMPQQVALAEGETRLRFPEVVPWGTRYSLRIVAAPPMLECSVTPREGIIEENVSSEIRVVCNRRVVKLSLGDTWSCALMANGTVRCWGDNTYGQLADGSVDKSITGLNDVTDIETHPNAFQTCAVIKDHTVKCWGSKNLYEELNLGASALQASPHLRGVTHLIMGGLGACATLVNGSVKCWGYNIPLATVPGLSNPEWMAMCKFVPNFVAVLPDGSVVNGWATQSPAPVGGLSGIVRMAMDTASGYWALTKEGTVLTSKLLAGGSSIPPERVPGLSGVVDVVSRSDSVCVLRENGGLRCWYDDRVGVRNVAVMLPPSELRSGPTEDAPGVSGVVHVAMSGSQVCALYKSGEIGCWGDNRSGQRGAGNPNPAPLGVTGFVQLVSGRDNVCGLQVGGTVQCWGSDTRGNTAGGRLGSPLPGLSGVVALGAGWYASYAVRVDGTVRAWGLDSANLLAGARLSRSSPSLSNVVSVVGGEMHACALRRDGTVTCWGVDSYGQTSGGDPTRTPEGLSGVVEIAAGAHHTCVRRTGGRIRCWGSNAWGQRGESGTEQDVPGISGAVSLAAGWLHTCVALGDGKVRCWGDNSFAQTAGSSVTQSILGLTEVEELYASSSAHHTCARRRDGTVRCWGARAQGQTAGTSPTKDVPGIVGAKAALAARYHSCVLMEGGEVQCWGDDSFGALSGAAHGYTLIRMAP